MSDVLPRQAAQSRATRRTPAAVLAVAAAAWLGAMALAFALADAGGFAWHMVVHLLNITVVAPLASATTRRWRPMRMPAPLVAAFIELLVVWAWHAPAAHAFARASLGGFLFEQASFLACAFLLWTVVIDALARRDRNAMGQSVLALLLTSMHMTLLGAVLALAARSPYAAGLCGSATTGLGPTADLQLGGALMLGVATTVYLVATLRLARFLLGHARA